MKAKLNVFKHVHLAQKYLEKEKKPIAKGVLET